MINMDEPWHLKATQERYTLPGMRDTVVKISVAADSLHPYNDYRLAAIMEPLRLELYSVSGDYEEASKIEPERPFGPPLQPSNWVRGRGFPLLIDFEPPWFARKEVPSGINNDLGALWTFQPLRCLDNISAKRDLSEFSWLLAENRWLMEHLDHVLCRSDGLDEIGSMGMDHLTFAGNFWIQPSCTTKLTVPPRSNLS
jgi:hypothetical protein